MNNFFVLFHSFFANASYFLQLKSTDVVEAYIERIQEVDPYINATVDRRFQDALKEAHEADLLIASRKYTEEQLMNEKPLLGVPLTVKMVLFVKGKMITNCYNMKYIRLRCTGGSKLFEDLVPTEDAPTVALMKKAGAIIIATTNTPEFGMNIESANFVHGRTRNPYNTNRTPGGSSGGESALIASGGSVLGLGNDLLGSLRIPAHFSGIFAHKPTAGLVPNEGCLPPERLVGEKFPTPGINKYMFMGPMCRYAEDLVTSMKILSTNKEIRMKLGKEINFHNLKICYLKEIQSYLVAPVDPEISRALQEAVFYFEKRYSVKAREVKMPSLMDATRCIINAFHNSTQIT
ncbi:Fatty-acid amide hydrolase 2 like protein [Argiope bruennichi]|uniref:Fatty-acid amide hydrolase 2 like protein n=1 Tax=Argiope bruennichi TaxID=94029 RepID=A0A8T0E5L1_ARGBR|nr:Fatty-acid amide hydrolase 2 like protein [Argiope bruennichi]